MHLRFAWQAWHLETSTCIWHGRGALCDMHLHFAWQAWRLETSTCIWGNRRATWRHLPAFGVAGVALVPLGGPLGRRWSPLVSVGRLGRGATLRGRRGTWRHLPSFHVAGVALGDIYLRLAVTWRHLPAFGVAGSAPLCVAGVALGDIYLRFTWQAWRLETSTCVCRGRRGAWRHLSAFGVAGVALGNIYLGVAGVALVALGGALGRRWLPGAPRHFAWQA